ncbi:hypothetical protein F4805DRAFT_450781 [Annulohypoxylon moriforme]|nr:hypothetical protein F4805DRAFT_450781 [Annulohypoxylon moriforme]
MPSMAPDIEVTDLPNFEDVTEYGVSEKAQGELWAKEVSRLINVTTSQTPPEFKGSKDMAHDTKTSYEYLSILADLVLQTFSIPIYDSENVLAEHCKGLCDQEALRAYRISLENLCNKEEEAKERGEAVLYPNRQDFFNFVDYCTAILARVICAAVDGASLHVNVLAHLARLSVKLKIVSAKPHEHSKISLDHGESGLNITLPDHYGSRGLQDDKSPNMESFFEFSLKNLEDFYEMDSYKLEGSMTSTKDFLRTLYFLQYTKFQTGISFFFRLFISSLRGTNNIRRTSITSYELCAMVYETGFERFHTMVYQDQDGDIMGTSDASSINCARNIFHVLNQATLQLNGKLKHASSRNRDEIVSSTATDNLGPGSTERVTLGSDNESVGTQISCSFSSTGKNSDSLQGPIRLKSMSNIVTIIIPLIMATPASINGLESFINRSIFAEFPEERHLHPIIPRSYDKYTAFFCLTTDEYCTKQQRGKPDDSKSLSNTLMRRRILPDKHIADIGRAMSFAHNTNEEAHPPPKKESNSERMQQYQSDVGNARNIMKAWILVEKGVIVPCKVYVYTVIFFCLLLVLGSVAVGVTIGQRISGVDPFNITTYCWVLAAFILLITKSIHVQEWTWNDFLHGRVVCKSVSELSSVTGVDDQYILTKLLQDESTSFLQTCGPYNTVFKHKSKDGFSIDRPLGLWTMRMSGLIMIEVESLRGRGLVCLDLRRGTRGAVIPNLGKQGSDKVLIHCNRLPKEKDQGSHGNFKRIRLKEGLMVWVRAVGFYGNQHAEFV